MSIIYERRREPSYVELGDVLTVKPGGILARRGLYRDGRVGAEYAARVIARPDDDECVFCEPRLTREQRIMHRGKYFVAFAASHPYEFLGDHPTGAGGHELVVPAIHTDTPGGIDSRTAGEMDEYLQERQAVHGAISFVRGEGNPSKSVQHVHYHSLSLDRTHAVAKHTYTWEEGVTQLTFGTAPDVLADSSPAGEVVAETNHFVITKPANAFAHFDGQEVLAHQRIQFDPRDEVAMAAVHRHLAYIEAATPPDQRFQTYMPPMPLAQPSNRIEAMYLGLNPVYKLEFDRMHGIAELVFAKLSFETVAKINAMRRKRQ